MVLCDTCINFLKELCRRPYSEYRSWNNLPIRSSEFKHHSNNRDLLLSALNCPFCALIVASFDRYDRFAKLEIRGATLLAEELEGSFSLCVKGTTSMADVFTLYEILLKEQNIGNYARCFAWISIFAEPDSPAAVLGHIYGRPPILAPQSREAFSLINSWLEHCLLSHRECRTTLSGDVIDDLLGPFLPTRIIDVGLDSSLEQVRLIKTDGSRGRYTALSYCWGPTGKKPLRTTRYTLEQHLSGIPLEDMPKTYRDAITVSRSIGVRYLWIDALCIIQDEKDDWDKECQRMGRYYGMAYLVIAAAGAEDPSEGCFLRREVLPEAVELPFYNDSGTIAGSFSALQGTPQALTEAYWNPLAERGWALQERILARRTVYFTRGSLVWSCRCLKSTGTTERGAVTTVGFYQKWASIVYDFTKRRLTYETDRLAALQGLAMEMQKTRPDQYQSGLWTGNLPEQLLWMACGIPLKRVRSLASNPSWSWASTMGSVCMWPDWATGAPFCMQVTIEGTSKKLVIRTPIRQGRICKSVTVDRKRFNLADDNTTSLEVLILKLFGSPIYLIRGDDNQVVGWTLFDEDQGESNYVDEEQDESNYVDEDQDESNDIDDDQDENKYVDDDQHESNYVDYDQYEGNYVHEDQEESDNVYEQIFCAILTKVTDTLQYEIGFNRSESVFWILLLEKAEAQEKHDSHPHAEVETFVRVGIGIISEESWIEGAEEKLIWIK